MMHTPSYKHVFLISFHPYIVCLLFPSCVFLHSLHRLLPFFLFLSPFSLFLLFSFFPPLICLSSFQDVCLSCFQIMICGDHHVADLLQKVAISRPAHKSRRKSLSSRPANKSLVECRPLTTLPQISRRKSLSPRPAPRARLFPTPTSCARCLQCPMSSSTLFS